MALRIKLGIVLLLMCLVYPLHAQEVNTCVRQQNAISIAQPQPQDDRDYIIPTDFEMPILNYLNSGGLAASLQSNLNTITQKSEYKWRAQVFEQDVTGDDLNDVIVDILASFGAESFEGVTFVYKCDDKQYQSIIVDQYRGWVSQFYTDEMKDEAAQEQGLLAVQDMNANAIPDLLISGTGITDMKGRFHRYYLVYEWNGKAFVSLIPAPDDDYGMMRSIATNYAGVSEIDDLDGDGISELILTDQTKYWANDFTAWSVLDRLDQTIWSWDGERFIMTCLRSAQAPKYRIQAIEDGGLFMECGDYESALDAYQRVLEDESLLEWTQALNLCPGCPDISPEQIQVYEDMLETQISSPFPTRSDLNSYAHYRLMLIHAAQDQPSQLASEYEIIQQDFAYSDYVRLAKVFWEACDQGDALAEACQKVESYAAEYGISSPLTRYSFYGVSYNGHEDLCPL